MFDAEQFMQSTVEGEMSTESVPVPAGEYVAVVKSVGSRSGEKDGKTWAMLDVTWEIDDPQVAEVTGRDVNTVRQSIFLDINDHGGLDLGKGKNIGLGRLREAVNQNGPQAWAPAMLEGQSARVRIDHRMYEGNTYADVKGVAKL